MPMAIIFKFYGKFHFLIEIFFFFIGFRNRLCFLLPFIACIFKCSNSITSFFNDFKERLFNLNQTMLELVGKYIWRIKVIKARLQLLFHALENNLNWHKLLIGADITIQLNAVQDLWVIEEYGVNHPNLITRKVDVRQHFRLLKQFFT